MSEKRSYEKPVLECCGAVSERTLGGSGPAPDGGNTGYNNGQHKGQN